MPGFTPQIIVSVGWKAAAVPHQRGGRDQRQLNDWWKTVISIQSNPIQ